MLIRFKTSRQIISLLPMTICLVGIFNLVSTRTLAQVTQSSKTSCKQTIMYTNNGTFRRSEISEEFATNACKKVKTPEASQGVANCVIPVLYNGTFFRRDLISEQDMKLVAYGCRKVKTQQEGNTIASCIVNELYHTSGTFRKLNVTVRDAVESCTDEDITDLNKRLSH